MRRKTEDIREEALSSIRDLRENYDADSSLLKEKYTELLESDVVSYICLTKDPETLRDYLNGKKALPCPWPQETPGYEGGIDDSEAEALFENIQKSLYGKDFSFSRSFLYSLLSLIDNYTDYSYLNRGDLWLENKREFRDFAVPRCFEPGIRWKTSSFMNICNVLDSNILSPEKRKEYRALAAKEVLSSEERTLIPDICDKLFGTSWKKDVLSVSEEYGVDEASACLFVSAVNQNSCLRITSFDSLSSFLYDVDCQLFTSLENEVKDGTCPLSDDFKPPYHYPERILKAVTWMLNLSSERYSLTKDSELVSDNSLSSAVSDIAKGYDNPVLFKDFLVSSVSSFIKSYVKDIPSLYALAEHIPDRNLNFACTLFSSEDFSPADYLARFIVRKGSPKDLSLLLRDTETSYEPLPVKTVYEVPEEAASDLFNSLKEAFRDRKYVFDIEKTSSVMRLFNDVSTDERASEKDILRTQSEMLCFSLEPGHYPLAQIYGTFSEIFGQINSVLDRESLSLTEEEKEKIRERVFERGFGKVRCAGALFVSDVAGSSEKDTLSFIKRALGKTSLDDLLEEAGKEKPERRGSVREEEVL